MGIAKLIARAGSHRRALCKLLGRASEGVPSGQGRSRKPRSSKVVTVDETIILCNREISSVETDSFSGLGKAPPV